MTDLPKLPDQTPRSLILGQLRRDFAILPPKISAAAHLQNPENPIEALLRSAEDAKEELNKFLKQFEDEVAKKG